MIKIEFLADFSEYITTVAGWIYEEWVDKEKRTVEEEIKRVAANCNRDTIPLTIVATNNNECAGTATIFKNDLKTMPELEPFLGALYVDKKYRNKGIGGKLIKGVIEISKGLGYKKIYLRTETASDYYAKRGWALVCETKDEKDEPTSVLEYEID